MDIISKLKIGNTTYDVGQHIDVTTFAKVAATLSIPPGASTLTNGTEAYVPGDIVRVVDQNADTGYVFYRLHAITNGSATWSKLDEGSPNVPEIVTIQFSTNIENDADLVNNATVTATFLGQSFTKTYTGTDVQFEIPVDTEYTLTYGAVSKYTTPSSYTRTSVYAARPIVAAQYKTCQMKIKVTCDKESLNGQTVNVLIAGTSYPFAISDESTDRLVVKFTPSTGSRTLSLQAKTGYVITGDLSVSKTAGNRNVTLNYVHGYLGLSVYTNTGDVVPISSWNSSNNSSAIGLALITEDVKFVIKKDTHYRPSYVRFTGATQSTSLGTGSSDGSANSLLFYNDGKVGSASGAYWGRYCARVADNKVTINNTDVYTYVGAVDEIQAYIDNYKDIVDAYTATGIDCRGGFAASEYIRVISSSEYNATKMKYIVTTSTYTNIANGSTYTSNTNSCSKYSSTSNTGSSAKLNAIAFLPYI